MARDHCPVHRGTDRGCVECLRAALETARGEIERLKEIAAGASAQAWKDRKALRDHGKGDE